MILVVPIVLLVLYFGGWNDVLALHRDNITLLGVIGNSYVHASFWGHLFPNLVAYFLTVVPMYFLLNSLRMSRFFRTLFLLNVIVLPTVISALAIPSDLTFANPSFKFLGFSGSDASLMGGLLIAMMLYLKQMFGINLNFAAPALIGFMAFTFSFQYGASTGLVGLSAGAGAVVIFAFFFILLYRSGNKERFTRSGKRESPRAKIGPLLIPFATLIIFAAFFYPTTIVINGAVVNVVVHYIGLIVGIMTAFFLGSWEYERLSSPSSSSLAP